MRLRSQAGAALSRSPDAHDPNGTPSSGRLGRRSGGSASRAQIGNREVWRMWRLLRAALSRQGVRNFAMPMRMQVLNGPGSRTRQSRTSR